jgi:hypothetical protein
MRHTIWLSAYTILADWLCDKWNFCRQKSKDKMNEFCTGDIIIYYWSPKRLLAWPPIVIQYDRHGTYLFLYSNSHLFQNDIYMLSSNWMTQKNHLLISHISILIEGPSWPWSYGSWIYNYLCNQCLSPLMLVRISLCDKVCQRLATGRCFSPGTPVSSTKKIDRPLWLKYCWKWR